MKHIYLLLPIILFLSGCTISNETSSQQLLAPELQSKTNELVVDLNESTNIIVNLLKENDIAKVLAPEVHNSQDTIDVLIKNFSPAEMAFEAEVLNFKDPVIVLFYDEKDPNATAIDSSFKEIAYTNYNKAKFVMVEVNKLFKLAEQGGITTVPTLMIIHTRAEKGRSENPQPLLFDTEFTKLMNKLDTTSQAQ